MLMLLLCCAATNLRRSPVGVLVSLFLFFSVRRFANGKKKQIFMQRGS